MKMHHLPDVVLPVPHPRLLRLTGMGAIISETIAKGFMSFRCDPSEAWATLTGQCTG